MQEHIPVSERGEGGGGTVQRWVGGVGALLHGYMYTDLSGKRCNS